MNSFLRNFDVVIIGGGPSGASAGIAYKKLNPSLKVAIVDKDSNVLNKLEKKVNFYNSINELLK